MSLNRNAKRAATAAAVVIAFGAGVATDGTTPAPKPVVAADDVVVGNLTAAQYWQHQLNEDCVEQASRIVLNQLGVPQTPAQIDAVAATIFINGKPFYQPKIGSAGAYTNLLFAHYKVAAVVSGDNSRSSLQSALGNGSKVIALVNGETLWQSVGFTIKSGTSFTTADHAVVVDEIDVTTQQVVLTDTGAPNGAHEIVSMAVFAAAWATSANAMIVAN